MNIKEFINSKLSKKPKATPMQIMHEKAQKSQHIADLKNNATAIRLVYSAIEDFKRYGTNTTLTGVSLFKTSPFQFPEGMTIDEACKVVSFIANQTKDPFFSYGTRKDVVLTSQRLTDYGFEPAETPLFEQGGYSHQILDKTSTKKHFHQEVNGVLDLFTVGGDFDLFKNTDLYDRYFNWYTEGVSYDEIRAIYERLDIAVPTLIELDPNEQLRIEGM